jgi:chromosome segregation ATPase
MSTPKLMAEFAGIKDLYTLLEVINNEDKISKCLKAIESERKQLNDMVLAVGKVKDIDKIRAQAQVLLSDATQRLNAAKQEAIDVTIKAKDEAEALVAAAYKEREATTTEKSSFFKEKKEAQAHLESWAKSLEKKQAAVDEREKKAASLSQEAVSSRNKYNEIINTMQNSINAAPH